jgi:hypothetical protein
LNDEKKQELQNMLYILGAPNAFFKIDLSIDEIVVKELSVFHAEGLIKAQTTLDKG